MDINSKVDEVSLDLVRELLIAISQSLPENLLNSSSGKLLLPNGHVGDGTSNGDSIEELRSELISISNVPSK